MTKQRRVDALEAKFGITKSPTIVLLNVTNVSSEVAINRYLAEYPDKSEDDFCFWCLRALSTDPAAEAESLKRRNQSTVADVGLQEIVM